MLIAFAGADPAAMRLLLWEARLRAMPFVVAATVSVAMRRLL
jgi:hypothetical protein